MLKTVLILGAKIAVSVGIIAWLLRDMDLGAVWAQAKALTAWGAVAAFGLMIGQAVLGGFRWSLVAKACGARLPFGPSFRYQMIGLFFNMVMPGMVGGDVVRGVKAHRAGLSKSQAANSVLLERLLTLVALVFLVAALQGALSGVVGDPAALWLFPALALGCVAGGVVLINLDRLPAAMLPGFIGRGIEALVRHARTLILTPKYLFGGLGLALAGQGMLALSVGFLAQGMGLPLGLLDSLILVPPAILAMTLPISIAGWGVREGVMVVALGYVGIAPEAALSVSVLFGLLNTIGLGLIGGVFWVVEGRPVPSEA